MSALPCLVFSNSFPPDHAGGYELGAGNLVDALRRFCGWKIRVFSSVRKQTPPGILSPPLTGFFPGRLGPAYRRRLVKRELVARHEGICAAIDREAERAEVILVFNPRRLIYPQWVRLLDSPTPVVFFVSDFWPQDPLGADLFYAGLAKRRHSLRPRDPALDVIYNPFLQEEAIFSRAKGVIFCSRFLQQTHRETFDGLEHQTVIHWGTNPERFPKSAKDGEHLKVFGFCGRAVPEKGLGRALQAFSELLRRDARLKLLVASDLTTSHGRLLRRQISRNRRLEHSVELLGQVPHEEMHEKFFRRIGWLMFPSVWEEPFASTVVEAMASGVVVIGSFTGGTPEILHEACGYPYDPSDSAALLEACRKALNRADHHGILADRAHQRILGQFNLPVMAEKLDKFVRGLL